MMATTSNLLNTFKVKIDDAVALVPTMVAEEKLKAVQFWNIISERLQEIVNNSAADISALAFELEKQNAAKTQNNSETTLSKNDESTGLKLPQVQDNSTIPSVNQQVNPQLTTYGLPMPECKQPGNPLPSSPPLVPYNHANAKSDSQLSVTANQILQSSINHDSSLQLSNHEQTLPTLISNEENVFIHSEEKVSVDKKNRPKTPKSDNRESEDDKSLRTKEKNTCEKNNKSLPNIRRPLIKNKRKKKNLTQEGNGNELESALNSIKNADNRRPNGCIEGEEEVNNSAANSSSKVNDGNQTSENNSSGIILMNAKSLRGTEEDECFNDNLVLDEDVDPIMNGDDDEDDEEEEENENENEGEPYVNEDGQYICLMCKKAFINMALYTSHKCSHGKAYTCNECHARFSTRGNLIVHLRRHTGEKPFNCIQCHAKFSTKGNLKRHIKTHSGERPWECQQCGGRFTEKKSLKVHMRRHTGEKPYRCNVCGKQFAQTGILQTHMAMHMDQKEHLCEHCGKSFRQKSQLRLHMMRHEGVRKFQCNSCPSKFLTKGDLERHNRTHTGERPFVCELCGKTFTRQQSLNEHMNRHYGMKPYQCKYCGKGFAEMSACYKHIKQHERYQETASNDGDSQNMTCDTKKLTVMVHDQTLDVGSEISVQQEQNNSVINEENDITVVANSINEFAAMNILANASSFQQSY